MALEDKHGLFLELMTHSWYMIAGENPPVAISNFRTDVKHMAVNKKHDEFHTLDMNVGWETPLGYPKGIEQKILFGGLDERNKRGTRTRLLRFAPGVFTTKPFVHEYWEDVFPRVGRPHRRQRRPGSRRKIISAQHLRRASARRSSRTVQVKRWVHSLGNALLRSGLSDAREVPGTRFLLVEPHAARYLDALRLRRSRSVQAFGQITHRVAADGHVLNQAQDAHAVGDFDAIASLQEFADQRTDFVVLQVLLRRHGNDEAAGDVLREPRDLVRKPCHVVLCDVR